MRYFLINLIMTPIILTLLHYPQLMKKNWFSKLMILIFNRTAKSYDHLARIDQSLYQEPLNQALEQLKDTNPTEAADICTGTGQAAIQLAEKFPQTTILALDVAPAMLTQAKSKTKDHKIKFIQGDALDLPFPDSKFDLVVSQNAPIYLPELVRIIKPQGHLILTFVVGKKTFLKHKNLIKRLINDSGLNLVTLKSVAHGIYIIAKKKRG